MPLGDNIKRERLISVRNKIIYQQIENELEQLEENPYAQVKPSKIPSLREGSPFQYIESPTQDQSNFCLDAECFYEAINNSQAIAEFDTDGALLKANAIFCQTLGYEIFDLMLKPLGQFLKKPEKSATEVPEKFPAFWDKLLEGKSQCGVYEYQHKEGKTLYLSGSYVPVLSEAGSLQKIIFTGINITEAMGNLPSTEASIEFDIQRQDRNTKIIIKL